MICGTSLFVIANFESVWLILTYLPMKLCKQYVGDCQTYIVEVKL